MAPHWPRAAGWGRDGGSCCPPAEGLLSVGGLPRLCSSACCLYACLPAVDQTARGGDLDGVRCAGVGWAAGQRRSLGWKVQPPDMGPQSDDGPHSLTCGAEGLYAKRCYLEQATWSHIPVTSSQALGTGGYFFCPRLPGSRADLCPQAPRAAGWDFLAPARTPRNRGPICSARP